MNTIQEIGEPFPLEYINCQHVWKELDELRSMVKPYVGIMPQSTFSNTIRAIMAGTAKRKTEKDFFSKFSANIDRKRIAESYGVKSVLLEGYTVKGYNLDDKK